MAVTSLCHFLRSFRAFGADGSVSSLCLFVGCSPLHNYRHGVQSQAPANAAYPPVDNVSGQSTEQGGTHIHAHVTMYVNGTKTPIPANVGIAPNSSCLYWLHTHDDTGVIHIEAPGGVSATFGNFLDIWGQRFQQLGYPSQLSDATRWQIYLNGKPFPGNFPTFQFQIIT